MLGRVLVGMTLALATTAALAQGPAPREGLYSNNKPNELTARLTHQSGDTYDIALSTTVPLTSERPGCGGSLEGQATLSGKTSTLRVANEGFIAQEPESLQNARFCEITMTFLDPYTLQLEEVGGCSYYHGAACSFTGVVEHDAKGI